MADETTPTTQITAQPDGIFHLSTSMVPVRAEKDGTWVPINTNLTTSADGAIVPTASSADVEFSAGGTGPAVTLNAPTGEAIALNWPTPLPVPTVSGSSATYAAVLPGVDLVMTATAESYSEVLVVKDAAAAANPALAQLQLSVAGSGVTVKADAVGGMSAVDPSGATIFQGAAPTMWDSSLNPVLGTTATPTSTGGGDVTTLNSTVTPAAVATSPAASGLDDPTSAGTITLTPPTAALTGPDVTYPVFIDPRFASSGPDYAFVQTSGQPHYHDSTQQLKVGYCDNSQPTMTGYCGSGGFKARSYIEFNIAALNTRNTAKVKIQSADVSITQIHSAVNCTSEPTDLRESGPFSASITWPGPSGDLLDTACSGAGDTCSSNPSNRIHWGHGPIDGYIQAAAWNGDDTISFALTAPDDTDWTQWKRFNTDPTVEITYNFPPAEPTNLGVVGSNAFSCRGITYVPQSSVTLGAQAKDNNPSPLQVSLGFHLFHGPASTAFVNYSVTSASNVQGTITTTLGDGDYQFDVSAVNITGGGIQGSGLAGPTSGRFAFTVDANGPTGTPAIKSYDYPENYWGAPGGQGSFLLDDGASNNAAAFAYAWDDPSNIPKPNSGDCAPTGGYNEVVGNTGGWINDTAGAATLHPPAGLSVGRHTLFVRQFDDAHNMTAATIGAGMDSYTFYVSPLTYAGEGIGRYESDTMSPTAVAPNSTPTSACPAVGAASSAYTETSTAYSWSGNKSEHLFASTCGPVADTVIATHGPQFKFSYTAPVTAYYAFGAAFTKFNHYGQLQFSIVSSSGEIQIFSDPNNPSGNVQFNGYSASLTPAYQALGGMQLDSGDYTIIVTVVGKDPAAVNAVGDNGFAAGLDFFTILPINNVTYPSIAAAQNNNGLSLDGTAADFDMYGVNRSVSETSMINGRQTGMPDGFGAGDHPVVHGVNFTMPAPNSAAKDNVVAIGQTITLSAAQQAVTAPSYIDLLVLATGGTTPYGARFALSINHLAPAGGGAAIYDNRKFPNVPDWVAATPSAATLISYAPDYGSITPVFTGTSPLYMNTGTSSTTTVHPMMYHVRIPIPHPVPVASVTLPNYGTTFTPGHVALHVLAISLETPPNSVG